VGCIAGANGGWITKALIHFQDEIKRPTTRKTAEILSYLLNTIFVEKGLYPTEGPSIVVTTEGHEFAMEMADVIYGYLMTELME
jgi:hypothetical protein